MRWDQLFDDLAGQAEHARHQELAAEVADRIRRDEATVALLDRVRAAVGEPATEVTFVLVDGSRVAGGVLAAGPGWFLLRETAGGRQVLLLGWAVCAVGGLPRSSAAPAGAVAARRTVVLAVRALAEADVAVLVRTPALDVRGTIGRVGADHLDVVVDDPRGAAGHRAGHRAGQDVLTVPFTSVLSITERV